MKKKDLFKLLIAVMVSELAGIIASMSTTPAIPGWYGDLNKPSFAPPSWVFGPVWVTLFALMGVSAFLVWRRGWHRSRVRLALYVFGVQLVLNTAWSFIFFGFRSPGGAFLEIICLWFAIIATMCAFSRVSRLAAWLLVPYLLWVSFAGVLNFYIWQLN